MWSVVVCAGDIYYFCEPIGWHRIVMEEVYQYAWKHRLLSQQNVRLRDGRRVDIVSPGILNRGAGPDFSYAKVIIDGREWVGNVEIHERASDWQRHGHHHDTAYDNVVLHVVGIDDGVAVTHSGRELPQLELPLSRLFIASYEAVAHGLERSLCHDYIKLLDPLSISDWLETLSIERLQQKSSHVARVLESCDGDWHQMLFAIFARALGFGLNADPMEMLARSIPLNFLRRHADNIFQLEALLFGQAGMLDSSIHIFDEYYQGLCREYYFLSRKYSLRPLRRDVWKYARTRPGNFPHRRIAMLARVLEGGFSLLGDILEKSWDVEALEELFDVELTGYWHSHFAFGDESGTPPSSMSLSSRRLLIINCVAPFLYTYGNLRGDARQQEKSVSLLESLPAERNSIVTGWMSAGLKAENAMRGQALLYLKREYCDAYRCKECRFGHQYMKQAAKFWNTSESLAQ